MSITAEAAAAAGLSQQEIDAINGVDDDQDDAALADIAGDDDGDDAGGDDDGGQDEDDAAGDGAGDVSDGGEGAGDQGDEGQDGQPVATDDLFAVVPDDLPEVTFTPKLSGELLPEFAQATEQAYDAADAKIDAIEAKFSEGELDEDAKRAEIRKVERERDAEIRRLNASSQNMEIEGQKWQAEQAAFFKANDAYAKNNTLFNALNAEVVRIANLPESAGKSGLQVLYAAKATVDAAIMAIAGTARAAATPKAAQTSQPQKPKARMPDVKTLTDVPAAAAPEVGQDRFAHLDKLDGLQLEAALARMSEADQAAYLAGR